MHGWSALAGGSNGTRGESLPCFGEIADTLYAIHYIIINIMKRETVHTVEGGCHA